MSVNLSGESGTSANCFSPKVVGLSNTNFGLNATCKDNNGNLFVAGAYTGNTNFGNLTLAGIGGKDVFLVKYNSCGIQQWAIRGGSTGNEDYAGVGTKSIATDASGNIFIVGRYNQTFTFYGNNNTSFVAPYTSTSNGNHQDGYLIKLNASGEILWGATLRGGSNDGFNGVAVDNSGNPIVTGGFNGCCPSTFSVTIYGPNGSLGVSSFGSNYGSGLVVKFDANGNILWKAAVYNRDTELNRLAIDGTNNIYLVSAFRSWGSGTAAQFIDSNGTNNSLYNPGIGLGFLVKLNSSGIWQWGTSYGNSGDGTSSLTNGTDVAIDENGNPWISGVYRGATATFYSTSGSTLSLPASTNDIGFIAKYSSTGVPQFVNSLQQSTGSTYFSSIAISNGTVGIAGYFTGNNLGSNDMLFAKYDTNAVFQSVNTGGGSGDDQANSVVSNSTGFVVSGTIGGASSIDGVSLNSAGTFLWNNYISGVSSNSFLWSTGETTATINPSPTETTTYWCDVTTNGATCRKEITITVNNCSTPAPTASSQSFCNSSTVANLVATGTDLKWYATATGVTALASDVALAKGTYYVSQTLNTVESDRTAVEVTINEAQITASVNTVSSGTAVTLTASASTTGLSTLPTNLQNGLVGYWPFNGNANDESGNGNTLNTFNVSYGIDRFGNSNASFYSNGLELGGGSSMTSNTPVFNIGQNEYTIGLWMKIENTSQITRCLFNTIPHTGIGIAYNDNNAPGYVVYDVGPANAFWSNLYLHGPKNNYTPSDWHYIIVKKQGSLYSQYIDGQLEHSYSNPAASSYNYDVNFRISGISPEYQIFHGNIDDVHIYNRAIDLSEISQLSNINSTPLISYIWSTGETTATINPSPTATTTYWCDVTANGVTCRKEIIVTVRPVAPTATAQSFCASATVANLVATGTDLKWYTTSTGGTPLANTTPLTTGTYYVSQTLDGSESLRTAVPVTQTPAMSAIVVANLTPTPAPTEVAIGTQTWTTKNLDVATYSDGTVIPQITDQTEWANLTTGAWCYYNNDATKGTTYGKLYNWYAVAGIYNEASKTDATQRKKLAPAGYHVPSDSEWTTLTDYLGGAGVAGGKMKESGTTHWNSPNQDATNSSGFTGLPGAARGNNGPCSNIGGCGFWWSSSEYDTTYAWYCYLYYSDGYAYISSFYLNKTSGFSVRCLRD